MSIALATSLKTTFDDAVARTREALSEQGFGVLTEIDVKATLKDKLDEEGVKKLTTLKNLSRRMERLIDRLLEYSHISRQDLAFRKSNITEVATEALETLDVYIRENHANVTIQSDMPDIICDRVRVGEIFTNLVTNAIKYNDKVEKNINIGCTFDKLGGQQVDMDLRPETDTGCVPLVGAFVDVLAGKLKSGHPGLGLCFNLQINRG